MHEGHEFLFDGMPVGVFDELPCSPGRYPYRPYRGPGHYEMQIMLHSGRGPRCYYETDAQRVSFTIRDCPEYGVLELYDFQLTNRSAA